MSRAMIISSDGHVTAQMADYRPYLEQEYREDFDAFLRHCDDLVAQAEEVLPGAGRVALRQPVHLFDRKLVSQYLERIVQTGAIDAESDPDLRLKTMEAEGIVGEVLFPNGMLPFGSGFAIVGKGSDERARELRRAGERAYTRWLADYCSTHPDRFAGQALVDFSDPETAVKQIRAAKEAGLRGVLVPPTEGAMALEGPLTCDPFYEPIWSVCEELDLPLSIHSGAPFLDANVPPNVMIAVVGPEVFLNARRHLWNLIHGGVLERHPDLRFVFTEQQSDWLAGTLLTLDYRCEGALFAEIIRSTVKLKPSEYFARQCFVGASLLSRAELAMYREVGVGKMMFGADFPHFEGTGTLGSVADYVRAIAADNQVPRDELEAILGGTAAKVYRFDVEKLRPIADLVGPELDELLTPLPAEEFAAMSRGDVGRPRGAS